MCGVNSVRLCQVVLVDGMYIYIKLFAQFPRLETPQTTAHEVMHCKVKAGNRLDHWLGLAWQLRVDHLPITIYCIQQCDEAFDLV